MAFQNFIVLGIIPGTDIQINFQLWLLTISVLIVAIPSVRIIREQLQLVRAISDNEAAVANLSSIL